MDCSLIQIIDRTAPVKERMQERYVVLAVWGMRDPSCAIRVRHSLILINGVSEAYVDYLVGMAVVLFNPGQVNVQGLIEAVTQAGCDGRHADGACLASEGA